MSTKRIIIKREKVIEAPTKNVISLPLSRQILEQMRQREAPLPVEKILQYTGRELALFMNLKHNWILKQSKDIYLKRSPNVCKVIEAAIAQKSAYEIQGYDLLLMLQESTYESLILSIFQDIGKKLNDVMALFNYRFEEDSPNDVYEDLSINHEFHDYSILMLALHKRYFRLAAYLLSLDGISVHDKTYNQYLRKEVSAHSYAWDEKRYDLLNALYSKEKALFWANLSMTPLQLFEALPLKDEPLIDAIIKDHWQTFNTNRIYMDLAQKLNQNSILDMIDEGEINPLYIEKESGNTALISAVFTRNVVLFEKLMELITPRYLFHQNSEGKSAVDYAAAAAASAPDYRIQHIEQRLTAYIKSVVEKPKVVIIHGNQTIYMNPDLGKSA